MALWGTPGLRLFSVSETTYFTQIRLEPRAACVLPLNRPHEMLQPLHHTCTSSQNPAPASQDRVPEALSARQVLAARIAGEQVRCSATRCSTVPNPTGENRGTWLKNKELGRATHKVPRDGCGTGSKAHAGWRARARGCLPPARGRAIAPPKPRVIQHVVNGVGLLRLTT